ncbi:MAG TPA: class I SAM-dependent methyltransferase [Thermoplasmata archaeon]|nr:class I SAM-dependent methyltransferase [Thermoplasmata archaeon]
MGETWAERARLSEAAYARDPERGEGEPSAFVRWAVRQLRQRAGRRDVIEAGCATGRDAAFLALEGYRPVGVDFSSVAIDRALERQRTLREPFRSRLGFVHGEVGQFLQGRPPDSVDGVLAHLVYMSWSEPELATWFSQVARVLRPNGLHLFAVRDTTDPNATKGTLVAPRTRLGGPHEVPYRYFTLEDIRSLGGPEFERVEVTRSADQHVFFVADRRSMGPRAPPGTEAMGRA